jgi:hypothetical protein
LGNGRANILNFFFGPDEVNEPARRTALIATPLGYELRIPFNPDARDVGFEILYSEDLSEWFTLDIAPRISTRNGHSELIYEISRSDNPGLFFKARVYLIP